MAELKGLSEAEGDKIFAAFAIGTSGPFTEQELQEILDKCTDLWAKKTLLESILDLRVKLKMLNGEMMIAKATDADRDKMLKIVKDMSTI